MSVKGRIAVLTAIAGLTLAFAAGPTFARDEVPRVLKGEVVAIHNAQEGNGQGFHEITILTAEQEQVRLRLGPMNTPPCPCEVGDPVQVRLTADGVAGPHTLMVRTLKNVKTKRMVRIRTQNGELIQTREQQREGAGTATTEPSTDRGSGHSKSGSGGRGGRG